MKCWFCDHEVRDTYCEQQPCRSNYVTYVWFKYFAKGQPFNSLYKVELMVSLWNKEYHSKQYLITYRPNDKIMEVVQRIERPWDHDDESVSINYDWKHVFKVPYDKPIITPMNYKDKLPLLLTLS